MKKLNKIAEERLKAQVEEAKELGLTKIASIGEGILYNNSFVYDNNEFSSEELKENIYHGVCRFASNIISFYNIENPDLVKISQVAEYLSNTIENEIKKNLDIEETVGTFETKLPGEE